MGSVGGESEEVIILPPTRDATLGYLLLYQPIIEPGRPAFPCCRRSDAIFVDSTENSPAFVDFFSDDDGPPDVTAFVNCDIEPCVEETGGIQMVIGLVWSDGTEDRIGFQSDVSEIPEPSSVTLLATVAGLTMFVGRRRRRTHRAQGYERHTASLRRV